ncbi:hypothetical protein LCGC14_0575680 [marine sediment metagenome]|uniref:Uncharacterized protein n=1 Tax=marine sediment metagenome TaxID=412755 RepID=A0A0F9RHU8_9ZZZZ
MTRSTAGCISERINVGPHARLTNSVKGAAFALPYNQMHVVRRVVMYQNSSFRLKRLFRRGMLL